MWIKPVVVQFALLSILMRQLESCHMPAIHTTSIAIVGSGFHAGMFNEWQLCDHLGSLDTMESRRMNESGQYSYSQESYRFSISPQRIDVFGKGILPEPIIEATRMVITHLDKFKPLSTVRGVGLNCDSIFELEKWTMTGIEFCKQLNNESDIRELLGDIIPMENAMTSTNFYFDHGGIPYIMRIEPHHNSHGKDLFTSISTYQDLTGGQEPAEPMECLEAFGEAQACIERLHECLVNGSRPE